jgi:hypothetical protein
MTIQTQTPTGLTVTITGIAQMMTLKRSPIPGPKRATESKIAVDRKRK